MTHIDRNVDHQPIALSVCLDLSPSHGGLYRAVVDLAHAAESPILSFRDGTGCLPQGEVGVPVHVIDLTHGSRCRRLIRLSKGDVRAAEYAASTPRVVFCHSIFRSHNAWVRRFCGSRAMPYVAVPHGSLDPWVFRRRWAGKAAWMAAYGRRYFHDAALVMYSTHAERVKAENTLGFAPKSCVVHWPVDACESAPTASERQAARRRLKLPLSQRIVLYLGRYHSMKRPLEIAATFIRAALPDAMLVMAGFDGDVTARQLGSVAPAEGERVRVLGPAFGEQRSDLFLAADAFVSWSYRENFCYSAAEALGFGVPVILSPGNDLRSELEGTSSGWFPDDPSLDSLEQSLRDFSSTPTEGLASMGESGLRFVRNACSRKKFNDSIRAVISSLSLG
jgi:glycosyltransferase involved in cell wall biosynthesis